MLTEEVSDVRRCPVTVTSDEFFFVCHNSVINLYLIEFQQFVIFVYEHENIIIQIYGILAKIVQKTYRIFDISP